MSHSSCHRGKLRLDHVAAIEFQRRAAGPSKRPTNCSLDRSLRWPRIPSRQAGRHFLQIPGPTPVPDRILRAMDTPVIDHRGPEFAKLAKRALEGIKTIFKTTNPVIIYTATGTGAWEAALANTLSPRRPRADGRDRPVRARCGRRWPSGSA